MSSCTAQELVWVGTTISEEDGDGEKSRIFFIHDSGDSGSEELHTPVRNISTEMNDFNKTCDGHLVIRNNPHSADRNSSITSHWEGVGNSLRVGLQNWSLTVSILTNPHRFIPPEKPSYHSVPPVIPTSMSLMRKPQTVVCPAHEMRAAGATLIQ